MSKITVNRGTTKRWTYTHYHGDEPYTLENATVRFTVKPVEFDSSADDSTAVIAKDFTDGNADGTIEILLLPSDTRGIPPGDYVYDIVVDELSDDTEVYKMVEGEFILDGSPTNRI